MTKIKTIELTSEQLENMEVLKSEIVRTDIGKQKINVVHASDGIIYKRKELQNIIDKYYDCIQEYISSEKLSDAVLPFAKVNVDGKNYGTATIDYRSEYKDASKRMHKNKLKTFERKIILKKLIDLVRNMHELGFTHNDLHIGNILYNHDGIKLIDFEKMKVEGVDSKFSYNSALSSDMKCLTLDVFSFLFDVDLKSISLESALELSEALQLPTEFKQYLISIYKYDDDVKNHYIDEYMDIFNKKVVADGKNLVNKLNLI